MKRVAIPTADPAGGPAEDGDSTDGDMTSTTGRADAAVLSKPFIELLERCGIPT